MAAKKVTAAHKAIMKYPTACSCARRVRLAKEYEGRVESDDRIIDAFCMNMVIDPAQFGRGGVPQPVRRHRQRPGCGPGRRSGHRPGCEYRQGLRRVRGRMACPDIAGQNKANLTAEIISAP